MAQQGLTHELEFPALIATQPQPTRIMEMARYGFTWHTEIPRCQRSEHQWNRNVMAQRIAEVHRFPMISHQGTLW